MFYLDPPYWNRRLYRHNFAERDFVALERRLHRISGKFLLSLDDRPEVRNLFSSWSLLPVELTYTARTKAKRYGELLISNFEPGAASPPADVDWTTT